MKTALLIGRYQPFHNGHLEVVKEILNECELLIIAVGSAQYSHTRENPFSGGERLGMISAALAGADIPLHRYMIVPIPDINNNSLWVAHLKTYCPPFDVAYTRNPLSKRLFEESNVRVKEQPLYDRVKYSGTAIREKMIEDGNWECLVPRGVSDEIKRIDGIMRLKSVIGTD
jgi:nicotinamide-nucleotide adenylyltransferase